MIGATKGFIRGKALSVEGHKHAAGDVTSGSLGVARGGTGRSTLTSGAFLRGNGTGAVTMSSVADVKTALGITSDNGVKCYIGTVRTSANIGFNARFVCAYYDTNYRYEVDIMFGNTETDGFCKGVGLVYSPSSSVAQRVFGQSGSSAAFTVAQGQMIYTENYNSAFVIALG